MFRSRGGYFTGLWMIEKIADWTGLDVHGILEFGTQELEHRALNLLQQSSKRGTLDR